MNHSRIIKKAILSEKSYQLIENGLYTFLVDRDSTKDEIAKAVEKQFSVTVKGVNVLNKSKKSKRIIRSRKTTLVGGGKKAIVALEKGQNIALFTTKKASKNQSVKESKKKDSKKEDKSKGGLLSKIIGRKKEKEEKSE